MAWIEADVEFNADRIERPIVGIASKLLRHDSGVHCHAKGQLLFSEKGAMTIMLGGLLSVLPPQRLAWIPPHLPHRVQLTEVVNYRSIYVDHEAFPALPNTHLIWSVSPLLREILEVIAASPWETDWTSAPAKNWLSVLWDELDYGRVENMYLPLPTDYRLQRIDFNAPPPPLHELTQTIGASDKTITRIFQKETGLGYQAWRQQWRVLKAVSL